MWPRLCYWVDSDVCPGSLESFREIGWEKGHDRRLGRIFRTTCGPDTCPNKPSKRLLGVLCKEKNNKANPFSGFRHL